jgi:hypothetical protein
VVIIICAVKRDRIKLQLCGWEMGGDYRFLVYILLHLGVFIQRRPLCFLWQLVGPRPRFSRARAVRLGSHWEG